FEGASILHHQKDERTVPGKEGYSRVFTHHEGRCRVGVGEHRAFVYYRGAYRSAPRRAASFRVEYVVVPYAIDNEKPFVVARGGHGAVVEVYVLYHVLYAISPG